VSLPHVDALFAVPEADDDRQQKTRDRFQRLDVKQADAAVTAIASSQQPVA
jgi:hypothetical protein